MTETTSDPLTVDFPFDEPEIACEIAGCDNTASWMGRGCADIGYHAACSDCYATTREFFAAGMGLHVCEDCGQPWIRFEDHFHVVRL